MRTTFVEKACIGDLRLKRLFSERPWWMWLFPLLTIFFLVAIPLFVWDATNAILNSADGDYGEVVVDPSAPGYESYVLATPAHLSISVDENGGLSMVAVMSLGPNDVGGAVLLLNPKTVIRDGETIASIFEDGGFDEVEKSLREFLSVGFTTRNLMTFTNWDAYTSSVSPLSIVLDDPLHEESGTGELFSVVSTCCPYQGTYSIEASEVGAFLSWSDSADTGSLRYLRQGEFWQVWIEMLSSESEVTAIPGEVNAGFGRMIWGLSRGEMVLVQVPQDSTPEATLVDKGLVQNTILDMIPFPIPSSPEARTTVRLLDAVGGLNLAENYSSDLVKSGAQILIIGNAPEFTGDSELIYHNDENDEVVEGFRNALGGGTIVYEPLTDAAFEVTIIIGSDLASRN